MQGDLPAPGWKRNPGRLMFACLGCYYRLGHFDETVSAWSLGDPVGWDRNVRKVMPHGADADRMSKEPEHRGIVGGVPAIQDRITIGIDVDAIHISHHPARHGELVIRAKPAKNPNIIDGDIETRIDHRRHDDTAIFFTIWLSECQACEAKDLIVCNYSRWDYLPDVPTNRSKLIRDRLPFGFGVPETPFNAVPTIALYEKATIPIAGASRLCEL
jgi:hypothetical protein